MYFGIRVELGLGFRVRISVDVRVNIKEMSINERQFGLGLVLKLCSGLRLG